MSKKAQNVLFAHYKTLTGSTPGAIEERAVKFACNMGFSVMAD